MRSVLFVYVCLGVQAAENKRLTAEMNEQVRRMVHNTASSLSCP
jgi:hypothetical protein